jgi:hypothetical protein
MLTFYSSFKKGSKIIILLRIICIIGIRRDFWLVSDTLLNEL